MLIFLDKNQKVSGTVVFSQFCILLFAYKQSILLLNKLSRTFQSEKKSDRLKPAGQSGYFSDVSRKVLIQNEEEIP